MIYGISALTFETMSLADLLGGIVTLLATASAALLLSSIWRAFRARRAAYFYLRTAGRRAAAMRLVAASVLLLLAGGVFAARWFMQHNAQPPITEFFTWSRALFATSTPTPAAPLPTATVRPSATPFPTSTPSVTPSPSETPIPVPTLTPTPDIAYLTLFGVASHVNAKGQPITLVERIDARSKRIYVFFLVQNAKPGVVVQHTWYHNAKAIFSRKDVLIHESTTPVSISWQPIGGFEPGGYEVHLALDDRPQIIAKFTVR